MADIELRSKGKLHGKLITSAGKILLEVKSRRGKHYYDITASIKEKRAVVTSAPQPGKQIT